MGLALDEVYIAWRYRDLSLGGDLEILGVFRNKADAEAAAEKARNDRVTARSEGAVGVKTEKLQ